MKVEITRLIDDCSKCSGATYKERMQPEFFPHDSTPIFNTKTYDLSLVVDVERFINDLIDEDTTWRIL